GGVDVLVDNEDGTYGMQSFGDSSNTSGLAIGNVNGDGTPVVIGAEYSNNRIRKYDGVVQTLQENEAEEAPALEAVDNEVLTDETALEEVPITFEITSPDDSPLHELVEDTSGIDFTQSHTIETIVTHTGASGGGFQSLGGVYNTNSNTHFVQMCIGDDYIPYFCIDTVAGRRDMYANEPIPANDSVTVNVIVDVESNEVRITYDGRDVGSMQLNGAIPSAPNGSMLGAGRNMWAGSAVTIDVNSMSFSEGVHGYEEPVEEVVTDTVETVETNEASEAIPQFAIDTMQEGTIIETGSGYGRDIEIDPHGNFFVVSNNNNGVNMFGVDGELIREFTFDGRVAHGVDINSEGLMAVSCEGGYVYVVDTSDGSLVKAIQTSGRGDLEFFDNYTIVVSPFQGGGLHVIDISSGEDRIILSNSGAYTHSSRGEGSPDGSELVSTWDAAHRHTAVVAASDGSSSTLLYGRNTVCATNYSPDGSVIAVSEIGGISFFDANTHELIRHSSLPGRFSSVAFPTNQYMVLTDYESSQVYQIDVSAVRDGGDITTTKEWSLDGRAWGGGIAVSEGGTVIATGRRGDASTFVQVLQMDGVETPMVEVEPEVEEVVDEAANTSEGVEDSVTEDSDGTFEMFVNPGEYGGTLTVPSTDGDIVVNGSGGVVVTDINGKIHFSPRHKGVLYVNLPDGVMANQMHVVPNAIWATHVTVNGRVADGENVMLFDEFIMDEKDIQWDIPEDVVGIGAYFESGNQGGSIGSFVVDAAPLVEEGDIPSSWKNVKVSKTGFSSEERRHELTERLQELQRHYIVDMNHPLQVKTDDAAIQELMYRSRPEWRNENTDEIIANKMPSHLSEGSSDYSKEFAYQRKLLIQQWGYVFSESRSSLYNTNHNNGVAIEYATQLVLDQSISNPKSKFDNDMESARFRRNLGMVTDAPVSGGNPNYHYVDVVNMNLNEITAIMDHFQGLIDIARRLPILDGGNSLPPAGDALTEFMDSLPEDLRELFMSLNNEQREALVAVMNNEGFLDNVALTTNGIMIAYEGGQLTSLEGVDTSDVYNAVGVEISNDGVVTWGNVEADRINVYLVEVDVNGEWIGGTPLQSNLPEAGSYVFSNNDVDGRNGRFRIVITSNGVTDLSKAIGISDTFSIGDGVANEGSNSGVSDDGLYVTDGGDDSGMDDGGDAVETSRGMTVEVRAFFDSLPQVSQDAFLAVYDGGTWLDRDATDEELKVGRVLVENAGSDIALAIGMAYADSPTEVAAFAEVAVNTYTMNTDVVNEDNESPVEHGAGDGNLSWEGVFGWIENTEEHNLEAQENVTKGILTTFGRYLWDLRVLDFGDVNAGEIEGGKLLHANIFSQTSQPINIDFALLDVDVADRELVFKNAKILSFQAIAGINPSGPEVGPNVALNASAWSQTWQWFIKKGDNLAIEVDAGISLGAGFSGKITGERIDENHIRIRLSGFIKLLGTINVNIAYDVKIP
ncbi:hypothetical protein HOD71_00780, partial [Candidatus Peribacteria bacterium]|nr:hypothetical protein [Candidatus Peribacteria bacterium]MBT4240418.1 hypothetical protein [Candidatus Peribacteria bacterium]MBT4474051.1 hypothetical protein [Candidatus Peribacteria bacterium]